MAYGLSSSTGGLFPFLKTLPGGYDTEGKEKNLPRFSIFLTPEFKTESVRKKNVWDPIDLKKKKSVAISMQTEEPWDWERYEKEGRKNNLCLLG